MSTARTYSPGFLTAKLLLAAAGLAVAGLGAAQLFAPARAVLLGERALADVVRVTKAKPGVPDMVFTTAQPIPEDPNRTAVFSYHVEFTDAAGHAREGRLGVATQLNALYAVGDSVTVAVHPAAPRDLFAVYDLRTWTAGGFLFAGGLVFSGAFLHLASRARRPIEIPEDTPADALL